ncbi:MAG: methyltransferase domain-containing protein [Candidatus Marinimicrobia bacterium]|nr:methyltransferase domain-containing protein [Candidatus Neomarinimicrobiota bacterium]
MLISICTPTHDVRHLRRAYQSLVAQVGGVPWEWVLGLNGGVTSEEVRAALGKERLDRECLLVLNAGVASEEARAALGYVSLDPRVRMVDVKGPGVGRVKRATFEAAAGDVLLELDHDDTLECRALLEVAAAFEKHPEAGFVYSDCLDVSDTGGLCTYHDPQVRLSWEANGWRFYESCHDGDGTCEVPASFEASPQSLSLIYWAPNHLRAWRRESYQAAGGHDANLQVLDDHDLLCRTFIQTAMVRIPRPLYRYHVHGQNTWLKETKEIAKQTPGIGRKYLRPMIVADVKRRGLPLIDLGGAHDCPEPWTSVDLPGQGAVIEADLSGRWPFEDSIVGAFRAADFLEHMVDPIHVMQEIHRCLVPGGWLISDTPSTDGRGAWQDPTHRSGWNQNSWWYWTRQSHAKYLRSRGITQPLFVEAHVETYYPNLWCDQHEIPYVRADVWADKPGAERRFPRPPRV